MTLPASERLRERVLAVLAGAFGASIVVAARSIEDSLLSDAVGAGGVPQGVGFAMTLAALGLFAKSFIGAGSGSGGGNGGGAGAGAPTGANAATPWRPAAARVGGLVLILLAYGLLLPWLGYPIAISLLVAASGWLAGAALRWPLGLCALATGPLLWLLFDRLLQVRMPLGSAWGW